MRVYIINVPHAGDISNINDNAVPLKVRVDAYKELTEPLSE